MLSFLIQIIIRRHYQPFFNGLLILPLLIEKLPILLKVFARRLLGRLPLFPFWVSAPKFPPPSSFLPYRPPFSCLPFITTLLWFRRPSPPPPPSLVSLLLPPPSLLATASATLQFVLEDSQSLAGLRMMIEPPDFSSWMEALLGR